MEENRKNRRKTGLLLSILGVVSLVLITAGVTYAFFSYAKEGQTENVITTGTIRFAYDETEAQGQGILIQDALPITDAAGKALDGTAEGGKAFHFTVTSVTPSTAKIPYVVTVKKQAGSTLSDNQVKLYLVAEAGATNNGETGNGTTVDSNDVVRTFAQLPALDDTAINDSRFTYTNVTSAIANENEKVLFTGLVPAASRDSSDPSTAYGTNFTLRMWLSGDTSNTTADYSPYEFMAKDVVTAPVSGNTVADVQIDAETQITAGKFITSAAYYDLPATAGCSDANGTDKTSCEAITGAKWSDHGRDEYERIAYVSADKKVVTRSQAVALGLATEDEYKNFEYGSTPVTGFNQTEQYYQINGQTYTVKVNVYAEGAKVAN